VAAIIAGHSSLCIYGPVNDLKLGGGVIFNLKSMKRSFTQTGKDSASAVGDFSSNTFSINTYSAIY